MKTYEYKMIVEVEEDDFDIIKIDEVATGAIESAFPGIFIGLATMGPYKENP